ncbi:MAG: hypothetical protein ACRD2O_14730, partial [Terriglobia bacterium]
MTDNLGRVAATADQILELLKKDAGLMVEFKRLLAQDAGAAGQILDESALTDEAVSVRLNEDLRARVLATRLLQKYGYLLPKINPNSELAAERSLVLQDRAYAIAHAAERSSEPSLLPPGAQAAGCDWQNSMDCDFAGQRTNPGYPSGKREGRQDYPQDQGTPYEAYPGAPSQIDSPRGQEELRASDSVIDAGQTLLTSLPQTGLEGSPNSINSREGGARSGEFAGMPSLPSGERESGTPTPRVQPENGSLPRTSRNQAESAFPNEVSAGVATRSFEPVRMVHQPNPYAALPSLYDLYVQASPSVQHPERFGLSVFQRGGENTGMLP